jgi:hypothetical protein
VDLEALCLRLRSRAESLDWPADSRTAEIVAVVSGGVLFAAIRHPWAWTLIKSAGRVYGDDGAFLDLRPTPAN